MAQLLDTILALLIVMIYTPILLVRKSAVVIQMIQEILRHEI